MDSRPRILLLGDYSNCHNTLATGLRRLGCDVTVASNGSKWLDLDRDIDLSRYENKLGGLLISTRLLQWIADGTMSGYDIVAINDVNFVTLRPHRLRFFFDRIRKANSSIFLTAMSTDIAYLDMVAPPDSPLRYSEWFVGDEPSRWHQIKRDEWQAWHASALTRYQRHILDNIDGAVSVLYEYHLGMSRYLGDNKAVYGGIPIDTSLYQPVELPDRIDKVRLFLGRDRNRLAMKGTDLLETAAKRVVEKHPDKAELIIVENRPFAEFTELLKSAHVVLDQIYSYTPATTALMAMAYGLNVVTGGEPEFYDFIGERENRPIINAPIELDPLTDTLEQVVLHPELIAGRGRQSREFVVKHNDCETVARRYLDFWNRRIALKRQS
ncbi:MAG: hypothetical protein Q4C34_02820 [Bacteroidales bacterium]|nr:hypothetical protein [Bacteroidales bacterium]